LTAVSILYPRDSSFRIFTWQLYVDVNEYRYYGTIQMNSPELKLIPLIDRSFEVQSPEMDILNPDKWYGGLYYNIHQYESQKGRRYLLFGFDAFSFYNKRKFVDVLSFVNGNAAFGEPTFVEENSKTKQRLVKNRLLKEYSSEASFKLNYDQSLGMIVFDHLSPMSGNYGQGLTYVPDGTYEGYKLQKGTWNWVENIPYQIMKEAPVSEPVLESRKGKDILGRPKKKNNTP
jgi:hypothetical protein